MTPKTTFLLVFVSISGIISCTFEKAKPDLISDKDLYTITTNTSNKIYYQSGSLLSAAGNSPHGSFKLWFNAKAASVLDGQLELPSGLTFPDSSLIVKEVYSGTNLSLYVPMYKKSGAWLWAEYGPNGENVYSVFKQGTGCIPCHSEQQNRDLIRTFDLH